MVKESKIGNLLKLAEYDHLQPKKSPTKYTEVGGYAILEKLTVKELVKLAAEKTGKDKKDLKNNYTIKQLKDMVKGKEDKKEEVKEKNESIILEEVSAKQKAARKRFIEMIKSKKKKLEEGDEKRNNKDIKEGDKKKAGPPPPTKLKK